MHSSKRLANSFLQGCGKGSLQTAKNIQLDSEVYRLKPAIQDFTDTFLEKLNKVLINNQRDQLLKKESLPPTKIKMAEKKKVVLKKKEPREKKKNRIEDHYPKHY